MLKSLFRERRRSAALEGLGLIDAAIEPVFNRFVNAAASAFDAPIAILSMIHGDRLYIKAHRNLSLDCMARSDSFCSHTLDIPGVLECCDPENDTRFANLPCVTGAPYIRYYVGTPLTLQSQIDVGALAVVDVARRHPASPDQKAYLLGLARQASMALEARQDIWGSAA